MAVGRVLSMLRFISCISLIIWNPLNYSIRNTSALPSRPILQLKLSRAASLKLAVCKHSKHGLHVVALPFDSTVTLDAYFAICCDVASNPGPSNQSSGNKNTSTKNYKKDVSLKCVLVNARSLKSFYKTPSDDGGHKTCHLVAFQKFVYGGDYDIIAVTETWLNQSILDSEILDKGYIIFRRDRLEKVGGGVLLAIKNNIPLARRRDLENNLEMLCVELNLIGSPKIFVSVFYRPPNNKQEFTQPFLNFLQSISRFSKSHAIVLGDFNFPNIQWVTNCGFVQSDTSDEYAFSEGLKENSFFQLNNIPTHFTENKGTVLDLVITNDPERVTNITTLPPESAGIHTDHHLLEFDLVHQYHRAKKPTRFVYKFKDCDLNKLKNSINQSPTLLSCSDTTDIDTAWKTWKSELTRIIDAHVPKVKARSSESPPWIDGEVMHLLKRKETARRAAKRSARASSSLWDKFKQLRKESKHLIDIKYKEYTKTLGDNIKNNPKRFWSYFRSKTKTDSIPAKVSYNNSSFTSDFDKAEAFNKFFFSTFNNDDDDLPTSSSIANQTSLLDNIILTELEVLEALQRIDHHKAPGPDKIPSYILKECADELTSSLCKLFNLSLSLGLVPEEWKVSYVVPVFKKGNKEDVSNYRPISLLCVVSKVLERCVLNHVKTHLDDSFSDCQHGFLSGRSTVTQLLSFYHGVGKTLDKGMQTDIIYLDLAKAFDSVSHRRLIFKLSHYGISDSVIRWFESYLKDRSQCCIVHGSASDSLPVLSGVPQGSILGPILFILYINDLPSIVDNTLVLFADDSKCSKAITSPEDCTSLQEDLNNVHSWSQDWKLRFNFSKCEVLSVTRNKNPVTYNYSLGTDNLAQVLSQKDLGVTITNNLKWDTHINNTISKCYRMLGFLRRHSPSSFDPATRKTLYLAYVRSNLDYASELWAPQSIGNISKVESIQRRATKYILKLKYDDPLSYRDRLHKLNLLPLSYQHELKDIIFYFKCRLGLVNIPVHQYFLNKVPGRTTRNSSASDLLITKCRTKLFQTSYFNRLPKLWNNMPVSLRNCNSFTRFKSHLTKHYSNALANSYDVNRFNTWKSICLKCCSSRNLLTTNACCY